MNRPLAPNIVRAVVREWLVSKNDVLDAVLQGVTAKVAEVAEVEATRQLLAAIHQDGVQQELSDFDQGVEEVVGMLHELADNMDEYSTWSKIAEEIRLASAKLEAVQSAIETFLAAYSPTYPEDFWKAKEQGGAS